MACGAAAAQEIVNLLVTDSNPVTPANTIEKMGHSSVAEQSAVNRHVVGSNPTGPANLKQNFIIKRDVSKFESWSVLERKPNLKGETDEFLLFCKGYLLMT